MKFFFFRSDSQIANITKSEIVEKVNNWGYSELFLTGLFTHGDRDLLMGEYFSVFPSFNILLVVFGFGGKEYLRTYICNFSHYLIIRAAIITKHLSRLFYIDFY